MGLLSGPLSICRLISAFSLLSALTGALTGCAGVPIDDPAKGDLKGLVVVEWNRQDRFIYRKTGDPVTFKPSFMKTEIIPRDMFTDGGSVPQILWGIPGLSPWAFGPAYIVHDWIFAVHRCNLDAPEAVKDITFEESAQILAEVGRYLVDAGLIDDNRLPQIVWAIRSRYARNIWDRPGTPKECETPPAVVKSLVARKRQGIATVVRFKIPPRRRR